MFDLSLYILDLIEHFIKAHVTAMSITVEDDRLHNILKITIKGRSPVSHTVSHDKKSGSLEDSSAIEKDVEMNRLRHSAEKNGATVEIGKNELGETMLAASVKLNSVQGEIQHNLAVMLSSVVCTNPDLDLSFQFRVGKQVCYLRVSDIKNELPSEKRGGLAVARVVQEKVKAELRAFEEFCSENKNQLQSPQRSQI
jgi:hypothetical protein